MYGVPRTDAAFSITPHELMTRELSLVPSVAGCSPGVFARARDFAVKHQAFLCSLLGKTITLEQLAEELLHFSPLPGTRTLVHPGRSG